MSYLHVPVSVIPDAPSLEELGDYLASDIGSEDFSAQWSAYAYFLKDEYKLSDEAYCSLNIILNKFFANNNISDYDKFRDLSHTQLFEYFNQAYSLLNNLKSLDEKEKAKELFNTIKSVYAHSLSDFELKGRLLNIRVSPSDLEALDRVEGKNRADKFRHLLSFYFDNI